MGKKMQNPLLFALTIISAACIFFVDISVPLGVAGGVPYVAVILILYKFGRLRYIWAGALICCFLTVLGFFFSPDGGELWKVIANRMIAIFAIIVTAAMISKYLSLLLNVKNSRGELKRQIRKKEFFKDRYDFALNNSGMIFYDWNSKNNEVILEGDIENVLGYQRDEVSGSLQKWLNIIHKDDVESFSKALERLIATRESADLEYRVFHKNGDIVYLEDKGAFIREDSGEMIRMLGFVEDITEKKKVALELRKSEEHFRKIIENASDVVTIFNLEGGIEYKSPNVKQLFGYEPEELIGTHGMEYVHPEDQEVAQSALESIIENNSKTKSEYRYLCKNGNYHVIETISRVVDYLGERKIVANTRIITERHEAEKQLKKINRSLDEAQRIAKIGSGYRDLINNTLEWSDGMYRILGYEPDEIEVTPDIIFDHVYFLDRQKVKNTFEKLYEKGGEYDLEYSLITKQRERKIVRSKGIVEYDEELCKCVSIFGTISDITHERQREGLLTRLESILEATSDFVFMADTDGQILYSNEAAKKWSGIRELNNVSIVDYHPESDNGNREDRLKAAYENGIWKGESELVNKKGEVMPVSQVVLSHKNADGEVEYFSSIARDLIEEKKYRRKKQVLMNMLAMSNTNISLSELLQALFQDIHDLIKVPDICVWEYSYSEQLFHQVHSFSIGAECSCHQILDQQNKHLLEQALKNGETLMIKDDDSLESNLKFWLGIPLIVENEPVGLMVIRAEKLSAEYAEANIQFLELVSNNLAVFMHRIRTEEKYRLLFNNINEGFIHAVVMTSETSTWELLDINPVFEDQTGWKKEDVLGKKSNWELPGMEENPEQWRKIYNEVALSGVDTNLETYSTKLGKWFSIHVFCPKKGEFAATFKDITDRKLVELKLVKSEELFRSIASSSPFILALVNFEGEIQYVNKSFTPGLDPSDFIGKSFFLALDEADVYLVKEKMAQVAQSGKPIDFEVELRLSTGIKTWVKLTFGAITQEDRIDNILVIAENISQRKMEEKKLIKSLQEKEVLLKEIHHRVKNNLQVIWGLLDLQQLRSGNTEVRSALEESKSRINSISILHENLYQNKNLATIEMKSYLNELGGNLMLMNHISTGKVRLKLDMEELKLGIDRAIPVGLIVNELVSNVFKHAFPGDRIGEVEVHLGKMDGRIKLLVKDDGIGFNYEEVVSTSLGLTLIENLTDQLDGELEINTEEGQGANFKIEFNEED